jgi:sigma-E factor negative regulatory protein RseC
MIEQQGRVVAVNDSLAEVRLGGTSGCTSCDAGKGCGAGVFGRLLKRRPVLLQLENTISARPGQPVMVGIPETLFLRLAARLYLFPLLAGVVGAAIGHYLAEAAQWGSSGTDAATLLVGVAAGLAALFATGKGMKEFPRSNIVHLLRIAVIEESLSSSRG